MEVRLAKSNPEFVSLYGEILNRSPEKSQLLMINVIRNPEQLLTKIDCRGAVWDNDSPILIFVNPMPYNLQLFSESFHQDAIDALIEYLILNMVEIKGVQGNYQNSHYFVSQYTQKTTLRFRTRLQMDIMRLDRLNTVPIQETMSFASVSDKETLKVYERAFFEEALGDEISDEELLKRLNSQIENQQIVLLKNAVGEILTMAMTTRKMKDGIAISLVYTPKKYRNKGFSQSLLYQLCTELLKTNKFVTLFVDKTNPVSNKLYWKLGFVITTDNYDMVIE